MCGFIGLVGVEPVAPALFMGLQTIQHRGQDAAGMGTYDRGHLSLYKDVGRVTDVLNDQALALLPGTSGIGHVRYPTVGASTRTDSQPFMSRRPSMVLAHNGQLTNLRELRDHLLARGIRVVSGCDAEPILGVFGDELLRTRVAQHTTADVHRALEATMRRLKGSYSVVAVLEIDGQETLLAFRDPHGIRPCVYGTRADGAWGAASESVSLDVLDMHVVDHVPAGSMVLLRHGQQPDVRPVLPKTSHHCIFEDIYFARPDSIMQTGRVYTRRWLLGQQLAKEWSARGLEADVVVAVPDTSRPAAQAMAEQLGIANREGFIKNRYSGRTFIMPDQATREAAMRLKLNPIDEIFRGQRVLLIDDSIVRGTTMRRIVQMVRKLEPVAVHVAIFSPPVRHPCFYGIDMPNLEDLVAHRAHVEAPDDPADHLARHFGADSVTFLSQAGLEGVAGDRLCAACFNGHYVVPVDADERGFMVQDRQASGASPHQHESTG